MITRYQFSFEELRMVILEQNYSVRLLDATLTVSYLIQSHDKKSIFEKFHPHPIASR